MKTNYSNTSMLDMVFENRNKSYGAYVLRKEHNKFQAQAIIITFSAVMLLLLVNFIHERMNNPKGTSLHQQILKLTDIVLPIEAPKPIEKKEEKKSEARAKATNENMEKKVVAANQNPVDTIIPNKEQKFESGLTTNLNGITDGIGATDGKGTAAIFEVQRAPVETAPVRFAEVMPEYPGGEAALLRFLVENTEYPPYAREIGLGGKVVSEITINEDGHVSDIKVVKSPNSDFDKAITRSIKKLAAFKPGMQQGKPVKVRFVLPFTFRTGD